MDTVTTVEAVTQWLTWITEVERQQPLWQQLEHPNEQYHLHLEATYLAQLTQYHEEEAAAEGGGSTDQDTHMPDAGHNLAESGIDIRSTTPPRRGWQSLHWSGVVKSYWTVVEEISSSNVNVGGEHPQAFPKHLKRIFML